MNSKKIVSSILGIFVLFSVVFLIAKEMKKPAAESPKKEENRKAEVQKIEKPNRLNVYYFHATARCSSCYKIEKYTKSTVESTFKKELADGTIIFREINVEQMENRHFIKDFELYTKQVIVEQIENGKQKKWKNLDKVWDLLGDETEFSMYIQNEVKSTLAEVQK